jgi:GTP-binding protein LepA
LEREFNVDLITTAPTVVYTGHHRQGGTAPRRKRQHAPRYTVDQQIEEPFVLASIHVPNEYVGAVLGCVLKNAAFSVSSSI